MALANLVQGQDQRQQADLVAGELGVSNNSLLTKWRSVNLWNPLDWVWGPKCLYPMLVKKNILLFFSPVRG